MNNGVNDTLQRRSYSARAGITALNLITPGLGLLRVGVWRAGLPLLFAPFVLLALFTFGLGLFPVVGFLSALVALALAIIALAALYLAPMMLTWRESKLRQPLAIWSRWYSLTAAALLVLLLLQSAKPLMQRFYKGYYLPSESMAPVLNKDDKVVADMRWRGPLKRGEIILFKGHDSVRVSRVAALPGDRIALHHGVPIVNGNPAVQSRLGSTTFVGYDGPRTAPVLEERLPGEMTTHRILDMEASRFDDMPELLVPPGHFFVLGDNRDRSADSRVPPELFGVGMVPLAAIIGKPIRIYWSKDHGRIGTQF